MDRSAPVRALCLDDDIVSAHVVAGLVAACGGTAVTLSNPYDVGPLLSDKHVKVVLSDLIMPRRDGLSVLLEVEKLRPDVRRVVVTAAPNDPALREALKQGHVHQVIAKPPSLAVIQDALEAALG